MRQNTRVDPAFMQAQKDKRVVVDDTPPNDQNSVPALRDRVTILEEILSVRATTIQNG